MSAKTKTIIAGVWMLLFGLLALWSVLARWNTMPLSVNMPNLLIGFVAAVLWIGFGIHSLMSSEYLQKSPGANPVSYYAQAWNDIFHQKWLLVLVTSIGLISAMNRALELVMNKHFMPAYMSGRLPNQGFSRIWEQLGMQLTRLPETIQGSLNSFFPSVGLVGGILIPPAILLLLPWFSRVLRNMNTMPQHAGEAKFVSKLLVPAGITAILVSASIIYQRWLIQVMNSSHTPVTQDSTQISIFVIHSIIVIALYSGFIFPLILGGLAGSLGRIKNGIQINGKSFIEDAVVNFRSLAAVYLLVGIVTTVAFLPLQVGGLGGNGGIEILQWIVLLNALLYLFLMFSPYEALSKKGTRKAISGSFALLSSRKMEAGAFLALGLSLVTPVSLIQGSLYTIAFGMSSLQMVVAPIDAVIRTFATTFLAVAVWEFHWQKYKCLDQ